MWKANGRKRGQRDSVLHAITCHSTTRPRIFGSHFGESQKNPCHLATVNGVRVRPGAIPPSMIPTPIPIPAHLFDSDSDSDSSHLSYDSDSDSDSNTIFMNDSDSDSDSIPTPTLPIF